MKFSIVSKRRQEARRARILKAQSMLCKAYIEFLTRELNRKRHES